MTTTEEITLAPAAGSGVGRKLAELLLANEKFLPLMAAAFIDALGAEQFFYDKHIKEYKGEPDYKTRLNAAVALLAHMEGDPVKRIIHQHITPLGKVSLEDALAESPALREVMARELDKAKWHKSGRNAKPADVPLDVG